MLTRLKTEYTTLTVVFNILAFMPLQFKVYNPSLQISYSHQQSYHIRKYVTENTHGAINISIPQPSPESLIMRPG